MGGAVVTVDTRGVEICAPVECPACRRAVATRPDGSIRNHAGRGAVNCAWADHADDSSSPTIAPQRQTAISEAYAAMIRAIRELDTARTLMVAHVNVAIAVDAGLALDRAVTAVHEARRQIGKLR